MEFLTKKQTITVLPPAPWLEKSGMSKGLHHDRQHLGIILPANGIIKVRQTNPAFKDNVTLWLLNDDGKTEGHIEVGKDQKQLSVKAASVPFIDTPHGTIEATVEVVYPNNCKTLPVYHKGDNENAFFDTWDKQKAEFGLIECLWAIILVPARDEGALKKPKHVDSIDAMIDYYQVLFAFYNDLAGLSFNPERPTDMNVRNRYFLKADKSGEGAAYYGYYWAAEHSGSVAYSWLSAVPDVWGPLHEVGHGYQDKFTADKHFWNGEVSNNIYAACYQNKMLGDKQYDEGWLYNYGKQSAVENGIIGDINGGTELNKWDLRSKLYFLMLMIEKAWTETFIHFNQQYRIVCNEKGFNTDEHLFLDMLSESFARTGRHVDVTPFVRFCNGYISPSQADRNLYSNATPVYPLVELVSENELKDVQKQLNLRGVLCLVDTQQLKATGITRSVTLEFKIDDFSQIYGETLSLLDGSPTPRKIIIQAQTQTISSLPVGIYTLRIPRGRNKKYRPQLDYLVVKPGAATQTIEFLPQTGTEIVSQGFRLLGIGDYHFCTVSVDHFKREVSVDVTSKTPHNGWPDKKYAQIIVKNKSGTEKLNITITGTHAKLTSQRVNFELGYTIEIYHAEPSHRLCLEPPFDGVIDHKKQTNIFEITASGLENTSLKNDPQKALVPRLELAVGALRGDPIKLHTICPEKVDIFLAIDAFSEPQRSQLLRKYSDCIPEDNTPLAEGVGDEFTITFEGKSNRTFLTVTVDLPSRHITAILEKGVPDEDFSGTYAEFSYIDRNGRYKIELTLPGKEMVTSRKKWVYSLSGNGGERLYLRHVEAANRLIAYNDTQSRRFSSRETVQWYRTTTTGLELMP